MPDYQKMYLTLFRATENAIELLIAAQRECEELYISATDSEENAISIVQGQTKNADGK
ncbi:MAG: hypothetical protein HDT37_05300 [Clostridiales bacterium]|nr:hypothetical protein [Clostridiales bacterium]